MKRIMAALMICGTLAACNQSGDTVNKAAQEAEAKNPVVGNTVTDAAKYQKELRAFYDNPETSPLSAADKKKFKGITFFPMTEKYVVTAKYTPIENGKVIDFPTSANKIKQYKELGTAAFAIDGKDQVLTLYVPAETIHGAEDLVFVPFKDATSGMTTYGAGRYLELSMKDLAKDSLIMDFNRAYNPYCAYSGDYNCPIPPENNTLSVKIEAGVSYNAIP